ncbi:MAG TPA: sigma-54 dependent transcriptional regulator [Planctomycetota bacterium]|nr:sigma-54 dependent transcriptional regulator [Planctomycetota bacterium]
MAAWRILIVDDEQSICDVLMISLKKAGYVVASEINPRRALERLKREPFDLVLQDLKMPEMDGIDLLREIKKLREETVVIIMTAYTTWDRAVEAMRLGAYDYIKKPFDTQIDIKGTISRALASRDQQIQFARTFDDMLGRIGLVVGYSKAMKTVRDLIQRAAPTDSTVIIQGESGVGKELIARALHYGSPRSAKPFIAVNCGALTETLLESELFGHSKGSFTGAVSDKVGLVEVAHTGTLFLDEVSEMSPQLQVKVLRLLEEKEFKPVGSVTTKRVDVRFITATNKDLELAIQHNEFRKDLFYRLNVIPIHIPPLRERRDDIPILAEHFLGKYSKDMKRAGKRFAPEVKEAMMRHPWPGNIRELENAVQRSIALSDGDMITAKDLLETAAPTPDLRSVAAATARAIGEEGLDLDATMTDIEMGYLKRALEMTGGNYTKAAQLLKMSLRSFRYKLQKYGIDKEPD